MFKFIPELRASWASNKMHLLMAYYAARAKLGNGRCVATCRTPYGTSIKFPIFDREGYRQLCEIFADRNPWHKIPFQYAPHTIVDLGANRGATTLYWKSRFPSARVIGVEMDLNNCQTARSLFKTNQLDAEFVNVAISDSDGELSYQTHASNTRHRLTKLNEQDSSYVFSESTRLVSSRRLGTILDQLEVPVVDVLKVDIEGAEQFLLDTIDHWSSRVKTILLEVHHNIDIFSAKKILQHAGIGVVNGDTESRTEWWCNR